MRVFYEKKCHGTAGLASDHLIKDFYLSKKLFLLPLVKVLQKCHESPTKSY